MILNFNAHKARKTDLHTPEELVHIFALDLLDMFSRARQGHMEKWEYWSADYEGDPAGGAQFWNALIKHPGDYYLPHADMRMIANAIKLFPVDATLRSTDTVLELGPGSPESIRGKTMPFLEYAKKYIAIDQTAHQARAAAALVAEAYGIETDYEVTHYHYPSLPKAGRSKTAFVMWGGAIGNIAGIAGHDPLPELVATLRAFADNCNPGDNYFVGIDTETRKDIVTAAYNTKLLSKKFLSVLFAAKKMNLVKGNFTPETWTHRSLWHEESKQCAHYLIAGTDQDFEIKGRQIHIKAGESVITNNSYKFTPETVTEAARMAGFSRVFISDDRPVALLMATK